MAASNTPMWVDPLQDPSPPEGACAPPPEDEELDCCVICQESRRYLKTIPCGHVFCEYCLQRLVNQHNDQQFPCPMCRARTPVPWGGASGYPISVKRGSKKVVYDDLAVAAALTTSDKHKDLCDACGIDPCCYTCVECQQAVCEWCQSDHHGDQHTLVLIRKAPDTVVPGKENCQQHRGQEFTSFCHTCKTPICELCETTTHSRHIFEELTTASAAAKKNLTDIKKEVAQSKRVVKAMLQGSDKRRQVTRNEKLKSEQEIRAKAEQLRAMVQQHENAALAELEKIGDRAERSYAAEISSLSDKLAGLSAIEYHLDTILAYESQTEVVVFEQYAADSVGQKGYLQKFTSRIHANGTIHIHTKRQEPAGLTHTDSLSKVIGSAIGFPRLN